MIRLPSGALAAAAITFTLASPTTASAQHSYAEPNATFDARIRTPAQILGYELGARFTSHKSMMRYVERVSAVRKRIKSDTVARSFEGGEMLVITVTSEANQARLADIQRDAQGIACTVARRAVWKPDSPCSISSPPAPTPIPSSRSIAPSCSSTPIRIPTGANGMCTTWTSIAA